jgi:MinD-like ATPase involved in chromosome partitioning or flagellar assembly
MLSTLERLRKIERKLSALKSNGKISDYRLILSLNMSATLYLVTEKMSEDEINEVFNGEKVTIDVEKITPDEYESDDYYSSLFNESQSFDLGLRRSLSNIINYDVKSDNQGRCPIISFYSYKGGVGRTTALALFGAYYAMHYERRVFIIDCDFEAPGLINFFGLSNDEIPRNGIVEYIKDKEGLGDEIQLQNNYTYEISKRYTGNGEIHLMPAGNIFEKPDRSDYLEALSRLDLHSTSTIVNQFQDLIADIQQTFQPDVILIDSRTGFNDVFGIMANRLSNAVVGFFGNNIQNKPGLYFFLDTLLRKKEQMDLLLVLSIISSSFTKALKEFNYKIESYIQDSVEEDMESLPALPTFSLARYPSLEKIGTSEEDPDDFISIVERKMLNDYNEVFEKLIKVIDKFKDGVPAKNTAENDTHGRSDHIYEDLPDSRKDSIAELKDKILNQIVEHFPEPYAENTQFTDEFFNKEFYIRKCMEDIFNQDKSILLGGKGTGKTAFYRALMDKDFFIKLQDKAQKKHLEFSIINVITLENEQKGEKNRFFNVSANIEQSKIDDPEFYYHRFWKIYIWAAIRLEDDSTGFISPTHLNPVPINSDTAATRFFEKYIYENDNFEIIENELYSIDSYLKAKNEYLILTFDQLDKVVKPCLWSKAIAPLIKLCHVRTYDRIHFKLFLRSDLFKPLGNLTNKASLEKRTINLEWTREELYAFFFKVVFANCSSNFFDYAEKTEKKHLEDLSQIRKKLHRKKSYNQLPPEEYLLKPIVNIFFGEYAKRSGETYNWIYTNLKNANDTISLRPFLDLIKFAVEKQLSDQSLNKVDFPVLSDSFLMHYEVRARAVERHFNDLAGEEGNESLKMVIDDIRDSKIPKSLKKSSLTQDEFESLMKDIINRNSIENLSLRDLEESLLLNGIIFYRYIPGSKKQYTFAYLYKYYLGLRSPQKRD